MPSTPSENRPDASRFRISSAQPLDTQCSAFVQGVKAPRRARDSAKAPLQMPAVLPGEWLELLRLQHHPPPQRVLLFPPRRATAGAEGFEHKDEETNRLWPAPSFSKPPLPSDEGEKPRVQSCQIDILCNVNSATFDLWPLCL